MLPETYYVERIVGDRTLPDGSREYRIKWLGYDELTWEPPHHLLGGAVPAMVRAYHEAKDARRTRASHVQAARALRAMLGSPARWTPAEREAALGMTKLGTAPKGPKRGRRPRTRKKTD